MTTPIDDATPPSAAAAAGAPKYTMQEIIGMLDTVYDCSDCSLCKEIVGDVLEQMRVDVAQRAASETSVTPDSSGAA